MSVDAKYETGDTREDFGGVQKWSKGDIYPWVLSISENAGVGDLDERGGYISLHNPEFPGKIQFWWGKKENVTFSEAHNKAEQWALRQLQDGRNPFRID